MLSVENIILDVAWNIDGDGLYMASIDNQLKYLFLENPGSIADAKKCHNGPIQTCHVIRESQYKSCVLTGSRDKTVKVC